MIRCRNCRRGFKPNKGARYCSPLCKQAEKRRNARRQRAEAKADKAPGIHAPSVSDNTERVILELGAFEQLISEMPYGVATRGSGSQADYELFRNGSWHYATKLSDVFLWYSDDGSDEGYSSYWDDIVTLSAPRDYVFREGDPRVRWLRKLDEEGRPEFDETGEPAYEQAIPSDADVSAEWFAAHPRWWDPKVEFDQQECGRNVESEEPKAA